MRQPVSRPGLTRPAQLSGGGGAAAAADAFNTLANTTARVGAVFSEYERVAKARYIDETLQDAENRFSEARRANPLDPDAFQQATDEIVSGYLSEADGSIRRDLENALKWRRDSFTRQIADQRFSADIDEQKKNHLAGIDNNATRLRELIAEKGIEANRLPEWQSVMDETTARVADLVDNPLYGVSPEEGQKIAEAFTRDAQEAYIVGNIRSEVESALTAGGPEAARRRLASFMEDNSDLLLDDRKGYFSAQGEQIIQAHEREIAAAQREAEAAQAKARAEVYALAGVDLTDGRLTRADADLLWENGQISTEQYGSLVQRLSARSGKEDATQSAIARIGMVAESGGKMNPYSSDDRKDMDLMWEYLGGPALMTSDPKAAREMLLNAGDTLGVLPPMAVETLQGMMINGDDAQRMEAMDTLHALYQQAPDALAQSLRSEHTGMVVAYNEMMANGVPQETAMVRLDTMREAKFSPAARGLEEAAQKEAAAVKPQQIKNALDGFFGAQVGAEPATSSLGEADGATQTPFRMQNAYREAFQAHYVATGGDKKAAHKAAIHDLKKVYGVSNATGTRRVMRHPPEKYYSVPGVDNKWMQRALEEETKSWFGARGQKFDGGRIHLIADSRSDSEVEAGGKPTYLVVVEHDGGELAGTFEEVPGRYAFPDEPIRKRVTEENKARAEAMRERALAREPFDRLNIKR